jgi:hypothetical protein
MSRPCPDCPFSPRCRPGKLGGSPVEKFIGQAAGPFMLHCHAAPGYSPAASRANPHLRQCAGAAIYRANTGAAPFLPAPLMRLPAGTEAFAGPVEMVGHHCGVTREDAEAALAETPVSELLIRELSSASVTVHAFPQ